MGVWEVERATGRVMDWSADGSIRYDSRFFDHVAHAATPVGNPQTYRFDGAAFVRDPIPVTPPDVAVFTSDLPEHTHPELGHSVTVLAGTIVLTLAGVAQPVTKFQTALVPPKVAHAIRVTAPGTTYVTVSGSW